MAVVVVSESSELPFRAGLIALPERVKAVNSHDHSLEPLFNVVPVCVVKMTAEVVSRMGSQITASINEKLGIGDIVLLGEMVEKRRP